MRSLLDLVLPARCAGCGGPAGPGCPRCLAALAGPARWTRPDPCPPGLPPVATTAGYDGPVRALLIGYKEHGAHALARPLGAALARSVALALAPVRDPPVGQAGPVFPVPVVPVPVVPVPVCLVPVCLVPVPSAPWQSRRRGADVVAELAACAVRDLRRLGLPVRVLRALRQVRAVADSAGLDARCRAANSAGALGLRRRAGPLLAGSTVVLVDDLVTTGASLAEATRVLRAASAHVVAAATVAATSRRARSPAATGAGIASPAAQLHGWGLRC
ncbi:MAG: ComF family protein [Frankiaceae bacterium]|nr:ComF family protein [Frankiaceae bacterium]